MHLHWPQETERDSHKDRLSWRLSGVIESVALCVCFSWPKVFRVHPSLFIMRILLSVTKKGTAGMK